MWLEANRALQDQQLEVVYAENQAGPSWAVGENCTYEQHEHPRSQGFFQPLIGNSGLQLGYNTVGSSQLTPTTNGQNLNGLVPGWML
uniref:Developmental protein SEPALLATA 1-like n=1 Tax=Tanacetum cinerariifolium TaxID=118510 RepID=A0A699RIH5_TANCI|nr:developmental protein SEPALLATA 1-like [Tanacetum cinerariifolium]